MAGESVLVSGGAGGIGSALCMKLAAAGFRPVVGYRKSDEVAAALTQSCNAIALPLDLADPESIDAALAILVREIPDLAGVVLAASPPPHIGPFAQIDQAVLKEQWVVNVAGPQQLLAGLVRQIFRKVRRGFVVGILSQAMADGSRPAMAGMGAYTIAKYGMAGLLAVLAADYPWLRIETVSPGFTDTNMLRAFDPRFLELMRERVDFQKPEKVATDIMEKIAPARTGTAK
jgi:NAD(P)-dependent dehydrogenase (short-subunit alcohol dehydrogenase family)